MRQRAARLSPDALALLRAASAASGPSEHATLSRVANLAPEHALEALDQVLAARLLHAEARRYDVTHAIVRRALYEDLNPERQAESHPQYTLGAETLHIPLSFALTNRLSDCRT